jgi:psiF repeat
MVRSHIFVAAAIALSVAVAAPLAQAQAPAAQTPAAQAPVPAGGAVAPKPSRLKMTKEHLKEMLAKWRANRPKFKACRTEARKKGLDGDDRWFFLSDCMDKS